MALWVLKAGASILLAARASNAQLASTTSNGNLSVSDTASPGPTATGAPCCAIVPIDVGLNFWWTSTLTAIVATVITQVYEYNNTAITKTATVSGSGNVTIPSSIIPGPFIYSATSTANYSEVTLPNTIIAKPTPYVQVALVAVIYGTYAEQSGIEYCSPTDGINPPRGLPTPFAYVEDPPISRTTHGAYANPPPASDLINFWLEHEPTVTESYPGLKTCTVPSGSGEPSVHVPVTGLTSHTTTTIKMSGGGPAPTTAKPTAEPITTDEPTTNEPEPEPTTTNAPEPAPPTTNPPAQDTQTLPPPENPSSNEPSQPPPAPTDSNPNPTDSPEQSAPSATTGGAPGNPQQPAPPANQPAPTTVGQPGSNNPGQGPGSPLPIDLSPVPAPAPAPTTAGAPAGTPPPAAPPAVVLPNGETLQPGITTTISDHTVFVPTEASSVSVVGGTTVQAPPIVVVDGTTATLASTGVGAPPVIPVIVGEGSSASVVSLTAAPTSGGGVVLPNGETILPGSTATYLGETLVLTNVPEGSSSVIQVIDSSTTEMITIPTAASSSGLVYGNSTASGSESGSSSRALSGGSSQTSSGAAEEATGASDELVPQGAAAVLAAIGAVVVLGL